MAINAHQWDPMKQLAETLEFDSPLVDCMEVADWLKLAGRRTMRYCPACQATARDQKEAPALAIGHSVFHCFNCNARGDAQSLVEMVLRCSDVKAKRWIDEQRRRVATGPVRAEKATRLVDEVFNARPSDMLRAFLDRCDDLPAKLEDMLEAEGIPAELAEDMGLRYGSAAYHEIMDELDLAYGLDALLAAGLVTDTLRSSDTTLTSSADSILGASAHGERVAMMRRAFDLYDQAKVPYMLFPYRLGRDVVHVEARPLVRSRVLQTRKLPSRLGTARTAPCFFNANAIEGAEHVLVFRRETDALLGIACGYAAVAYGSLSMIRPGWLANISGKRVTFVTDDGRAQDPRWPGVEAMFRNAGVTEIDRFIVTAKTPMMLALQMKFGV